MPDPSAGEARSEERVASSPPGASEVPSAPPEAVDIDAQLDALFEGRVTVPPELGELIGFDRDAVVLREEHAPAAAEPTSVALEPPAPIEVGSVLADMDESWAYLDESLVADFPTQERRAPAGDRAARRKKLPGWLPAVVVGGLIGIAAMAALFPGRRETTGEPRDRAVEAVHSWEHARDPEARPLSAGMRRAQAVPAETSATDPSAAGAVSGAVAYQPPFPVLRVLPEYDPHALSGPEKVVLRVLVDEHGHAARVLVESGNEGSAAVAAAVDAVVQAHYRPAVENGLRVAAWTTESFLFSP